MPNPKNPHNEPCKQMFLDAIAAAIADKKPQSEINKLEAAFDVLKADPALSNHINQRWYSHRIPDNSVQYIQSKVLDKCYERYSCLTAEEEHLFSLLERLQDPATSLVLVKKAYIADLCNMSQGDARKIQKRLDKLEEVGLIEWVFKPRRGSKSYGVIKINNSVSWIGSNKHIPNVTLKVSSKVKYRQAAAYAVIDGQKMRCGTIEFCEESSDKSDKKQGANATNVNPSQDIQNSPISQIHDNQIPLKKQVPKFQSDACISPDELPEI